MFRTGDAIGPFVVERELGSGAMGTVYRVRYAVGDHKLPKVVALKTVAASLLSNEGMVQRFDREAQILQQLRHPNIVRLYATGKYRDVKFIAMEYVDGESLEKPLGTYRKIAWQEVCRLGKQLAAALQHAHDKGIIHRDLKPSNLMMSTEGVLKLTDFGIAKDVDVTALTGANNTLGTAAYMSPEQCRGERFLTGKSDLYSLGVVFYELLTGDKPFDAEAPIQMFMMHVNDPPPRLRVRNPEVPPQLETLVLQLLEKRPEHRPRDAAMVEQVLAEIEEKGYSPAALVGEAATGRAIDSQLKGSMTSEEDRAAVRAIKAGARRKKLRRKVVPVYQRTWFGVTAAALVLVVGVVVAAKLLAPPSAKEMFARIEQSSTPEERSRAIKEYIRAHGETSGDLTAKVRTWERDERVGQRAAQLLKRHGVPGFRARPDEGEDPEAHRLTMAALSAENDGLLDEARDDWRALEAEFASNTNPELALWGLVGARKLRELDDIAEQKKALVERVEQAKIDGESPRAEGDEKQALYAVRAELFGDTSLARQTWIDLAESAEKDPARRTWRLLGRQKAKQLALDPVPKPGERPKFAAEKLALAESEFARAANQTNQSLRSLGLREARYISRTLHDLYAGLPETKLVAAKAAALLATIAGE